MAARATARSQKPVPVEEPEDEFEEIEDAEDDGLDEIEEPEEAPVPKKTAKPKTAPKNGPDASIKGSAWLAAHVTEVTGESFDGRSVRMLLRKLAKDEVFQREVGVTRDRYEFTGSTDPIVKAVIALVTSGEAKAMKQAGLEAVKEKSAQKRAAAKAAKEAESDDSDEMEDADDEEVEEAPPAKPATRRRAAPAKAAPAKATPATTRRRASATK